MTIIQTKYIINSKALVSRQTYLKLQSANIEFPIWVKGTALKAQVKRKKLGDPPPPRIHQIKQGEIKSILRQINLSLIFWMVMRCGRAHLGQRGQDISVNCPFDILFFSSSTSSLTWTPTRKEIYNTIFFICSPPNPVYLLLSFAFASAPCSF